MKALAINASPQKEKGNTALILNPFLEGMRQAGAETEIIYSIKEDIRPCRGCFHCWLRSPGECIQNDGMRTILKKMADSEIWVLASPLFADGFASSMSVLMERVLPLVEPFIVERQGHCRHPLRKEVKSGKIVLVSNCGFHELDNFEAMVLRAEAFSRNVNRIFAGALLRPHGPAMTSALLPNGDILRATREAGRQLVTSGRMERETLDTVSRALLPKSFYTYFANRDFKKQLKNKK